MVHGVLHVVMVHVVMMHVVHVMVVATGLAVRVVVTHRRRGRRYRVGLLGHGRRWWRRHDRCRCRRWRARTSADERHNAGDGKKPSWVTHVFLPC